MRQNFKRDKRQKEESRKKKQEEKRNRRFHKNVPESAGEPQGQMDPAHTVNPIPPEQGS